jgi:hypothetical protein
MNEKTTMQKLKKAAAAIGCTVEEERGDAIYVHAPEGMAWEGGELHSLVAVYGNCGSYLPEWRQNAIEQLAQQVEEYGKPETEDEE